jgi:polyferredoxin
MKQTQIMSLVAWAISATTAGYLLPQILINNGGSIPISPWSIVVTLPLIAIALVVMAIPIYRYRRAILEIAKTKSLTRPKRLNPFYAVRVLLLAKSIAISGSMFTGWHLGVVWLQVTSPVIPSSTLQNALALIGSFLMTAIALIVERICKITEDSATDSSEIETAGNQGEPA